MTVGALHHVRIGFARQNTQTHNTGLSGLAISTQDGVPRHPELPGRAQAAADHCRTPVLAMLHGPVQTSNGQALN